MSKSFRKGGTYGLLSQYCGPFNDMLGIPRYRTDQLCRIHDQHYDYYISQGLNPYTALNKADAEFVQSLISTQPDSMSEYVVNTAARVFFSFKKHLGRGHIAETPDQVLERFQAVREKKPDALAGTFNPPPDTRPNAAHRPDSFQSPQVTNKRPADNQISPDPNKRLKGSSLLNLPSSAQMVDQDERAPKAARTTAFTSKSPGESGNKAQETPVTRIPKHVSIGPPEFFTTKHRIFAHDVMYQINEGYNDNLDLDVRVNSLWDCIDSNTNATAGGVNISQLLSAQPTWRKYYADHYDYYTVMSCEYRFTFTNYSPNDFWLFYRTYGATLPPGLNGKGPTDLMQDEKMKRIFLPRAKYEFTADEVSASMHLQHSPTATIAGYVTHKDFDANIMEIQQDKEAQTWTERNRTPSLMHRLKIMPRRKMIYNDTYGYYPPPYTGVNAKMICEVEMIYTVQWKQQRSELKYLNYADDVHLVKDVGNTTVPIEPEDAMADGDDDADGQTGD